ncbi:hypothetical protein J2S25_000125 [Mesobacillus stamsii]|uniref:Cytosolic protein n=2 Tax=Mesobacillus stamsii TaxID=225347 RepID=A0ABU0FPW7_9BACI|nr:hypothetical protein [Mesobacillus stamsii]
MTLFDVKFHAEDQVETMKVEKLGSEDYDQATEGGTRHLFDLDTNIGFFVFFDAEDKEGKVSYLMLQYEDDNEMPTNCYGFTLKDFYEFSALYLNDLEFTEELNEEEGELGPVQHLAHLIYHIVEEGSSVEV